MFLQQHKHISLEFLLLTFYSGNCTDIHFTIIIIVLHHIIYFMQYISTFKSKQVHKMNLHFFQTGRNFWNY